jgi:1,4-alpha-glucan branching enzyme
MVATIEAHVYQQLVSNTFPDVMALLGPHRQDDGWVVRVFYPRARRIALAIGGQDREQDVEMEETFPGLFQCTLDAEPVAHAYQLRLTDHEGHEEVCHDPYAFRRPRVSDLDEHLFVEGTHHRLWEKLGSHPCTLDGVAGVHFAVWAPSARNVSVIGNFNHWDGRAHQMIRLHNSGIWWLFVPGLAEGEIYKYEVKNGFGHIYEKSDPFGFQQEVRPCTGSIVTSLERHRWSEADAAWLERRRTSDPLRRPIAIYEVHLGSWRRVVAEGGERFLTYRELADVLVPYVVELGFTHIELLPVMEHPFDGSWGYQVLGYYAPTSRHGSPADFMAFVDRCHQAGIGVILDWVPAHFPKDGHGLAHFDGTHLYEHADPRQGEHREWGTLVFNYGRNEVRNYLIANALYWFDCYHIDGIRVDAVAAMLYLNYSRKDGEWVANRYGGVENLEAIAFLCELNTLLFQYFPGVLSIAEESTAWPLVSKPIYLGGLGFNLKWNMGWMHDTLHYFKHAPEYRRWYHNDITFSITYAFYENFVLALSHDEVVHMKGSMIGKMPGDGWQKFANLRALYTFMYGHPGKKTLFMGMEFAQGREWNVWQSLDWHQLEIPEHARMQRFFVDLHSLYRSEAALWEEDFSPTGFWWIDCHDVDNSVFSFVRQTKDASEFLVFVCNFRPIYHAHYRVGVPVEGFYAELFNSDAALYGGSNQGNLGGLHSDPWPLHGQSASLGLQVPPLACLVLKLVSRP